MNAGEIIAAEARYLVPTYVRPPVVFDRGEGAFLYDFDGKRYLDFSAGIAVTALGHSDPEWAAGLADQAARLTHVSNLFHSAQHVQLARRLVEHSFADRVFFCNSGAEANEAALKFARRWALAQHGEGRADFLAFEGSFHGRTVGALSLTAREKYRAPFEPLMPGVAFAPFNDGAGLSAAITDRTCAVIVEPIQGEGGVIPADPDFLAELRRLCTERSALLIFDEVQCGLGRTGRLWAYEGYGVEPDILTLAKPLAGGLPIGAALVTEDVAQCIHVGDHGSTFAAGPLVCRAAEVVFDRITAPGFLEEVAAKGAYLRRKLEALPSQHIVTVRGAGLLLGVVLDVPVRPLIQAALEAGLIVINAGEDVLRLCPPLVVSRDQIDAAAAMLANCLERLDGAGLDA